MLVTVQIRRAVCNDIYCDVYSATSLNRLSEIGTTSLQWTNFKASIDSLQEPIDQYL